VSRQATSPGGSSADPLCGRPSLCGPKKQYSARAENQRFLVFKRPARPYKSLLQTRFR
jgi:hypothetical protein